mmetsp:Transcript_40852/g.95926  ORF Transcript_40852/g.95926 Transcript_40852/m.95926 type:complete len:124 (-) Transcript_40852:102-473(-)
MQAQRRSEGEASFTHRPTCCSVPGQQPLLPAAAAQRASLSFLRGKTLTVLDAGLALKTQGSLVNGFTPFLAFVAGFSLSFMLSMPANLKLPLFFSSAVAISMTASMQDFTSEVLRPVFSATLL